MKFYDIYENKKSRIAAWDTKTLKPDDVARVAKKVRPYVE